MINPPIKKKIVATSELNCKLERPEIECPEVHPLAYRVPKPTKKPPNAMNKKPFSVNNIFQLNISAGRYELKSVTPIALRSLTVSVEIFTLLCDIRN